MQTQSIQFGKHHKHPHSQTLRMGGKFVTTHPKSTGDKDHDKLVKTTQRWVAQTFYGQMLKQMRDSPFKDKIFSGGKGGEAFTQMFDQKLADKMAKGAGHKLVDAIVEKIESQKKSTASARTPKSTAALLANAGDMQ